MIACLLVALGLTAPAPILWADTLIGDVQRQSLNVPAIVTFVAFVDATLCIIYWASKHNRSTIDYYIAGGRIIGFQNGLVIVGDYMSMASFLGISALVFTSGYDGLIYSIGFLVGWPIILFLIAERPHNLGKYAFADAASYRLEQKQIRTLSAHGSLVAVVFYLIARIASADELIELLFGPNHHTAMALVDILVVLYMLLGGMLVTAWVQIIKAMLLLSGASFMAIVMLKHANLGASTLFSEAIKVHPKGEAIMNPGGPVKDPVSALSLDFALMFDTTGLPRILMHFLTVSDAKEACKSVFYTADFIGYLYILTFIIGFGTVLLASTDPDFKDVTGVLTGGNSMTAVYLADAAGGSLLLGFISVVAFATILVVVTGLALTGAPAVSYDLYASVLKGGKTNEKDGLRASETTIVTLGVVAVAFSILFEKQNIAFVVGLVFSIATSYNFPVLLLSMYWKKLTTRGAIIGGWMGLTIAVDLMILGPTIRMQIFGHERAIYLYGYLVLFSMIVAFVGIWFFFITDKSAAADKERACFFPQFICSQTGLGASSAVAH